MGKRYRSLSRAIKRGHLALHVHRTSNNVVHTSVVYTQKRFGDKAPERVYMQLESFKGDPQ